MSEEIAKHNELGGVISPNGFEGKRKVLLQSADLEDTLKHIKQIAIRDAYQVKDLAYSLQGDSIRETAQNIWDYLRENTRYKLDQKGKEELEKKEQRKNDDYFEREFRWRCERDLPNKDSEIYKVFSRETL